MVEGMRGGGGPEDKPSHNLENIAEHVRTLRQESDFRGEPKATPLKSAGLDQASEQLAQQPVDEVSEGLILFPGETSPRSPPDSSLQGDDELQADKLDDFPLVKFPPAIFVNPLRIRSPLEGFNRTDDS
jgi:hypothetical protein